MYKRLKILEYAVSGLFREKVKNSVVIFTYALNVFLVISIVLLTDALYEETKMILGASPELVVQNLKGGRHELIPLSFADEIQSIRGVRGVTPRYWGYYYDPPTTGNYTFMGIEGVPREIFEMIEDASAETGGLRLGREGKFIRCVVGEGVADLRFIGVDDIIPILGSDGNLYVLKVVGIFNVESAIMTNDLILMSEKDLQQVFDFAPGACTDLVVQIRNSREVDTIIRKIQERLPMTRTISRDQIVSTYKAVFGWRSGVAISLMIGSILAFVVLAWDKASGLSAQERQGIGILKAIGWNTSDVLELKFWEGFVISSVSFLTGLTAAFLHVFFLGGVLFSPIIKGWSILFPDFRPMPHIDPFKLMVVFCVTVIPYIAATILPAWKAAITDPDAVMR